MGGVAPQRRARGRERRVVEESSEALADADEGLWALQVLALQPVARLLSKGLLDERGHASSRERAIGCEATAERRPAAPGEAALEPSPIPRGDEPIETVKVERSVRGTGRVVRARLARLLGPRRAVEGRSDHETHAEQQRRREQSAYEGTRWQSSAVSSKMRGVGRARRMPSQRLRLVVRHSAGAYHAFGRFGDCPRRPDRRGPAAAPVVAASDPSRRAVSARAWAAAARVRVRSTS